MSNHTQLSPFKSGVAFGGLLGLCHLGWSTLVAIGLAQYIVDTIFELHMVQKVLVIMPFDANKAVGLVLVTSGLGFIFGYLFGMLWNACRKV